MTTNDDGDDEGERRAVIILTVGCDMLTALSSAVGVLADGRPGQVTVH